MISNTKVDIFQFTRVAAMAPPVPGWFKPSLQAPPEPVLQFSRWVLFLRSDQRQWLAKYYNEEEGTWDPKFGGKKLKALVKEHMVAWNKFYNAMQQWEQYRDQETLFQWQILYADEIFRRADNHLNQPRKATTNRIAAESVM